MPPTIHRAVRLVCLAGAATAPLLTALICREFSRYAVNHAFLKTRVEIFPELTRALIMNVADGSLPLPLLDLLTSATIAAAGACAIFSKRLTNEAGMSALIVICCISYCSALAFMGSSLMAFVLPFLPNDPN